MTLFDFISGIKQGYINQKPNLKEMKRMIDGYGWNVKYKHSFSKRWWWWIKYHDCDYELTANYDDSRNFTS